MKELHSGVKKLIVSEILLILTTVLSVVTLAIENETVQALLGVGMLVIALVCCILNLVAVVKLRKTNKNFNEAFWLTIALIVIEILSSVLPNLNAELFSADSYSVVKTVFTAGVALAIIFGIAQELPDLKKFGYTVAIIYLIMLALGVILELIQFSDAIVNIISVVISIVTLVYQVAYIVYLGKAVAASK